MEVTGFAVGNIELVEDRFNDPCFEGACMAKAKGSPVFNHEDSRETAGEMRGVSAPRFKGPPS